MEVFKYDWGVVFKDMITGKRTRIKNDVESLRRFYEENKTDLFIGYNNSGYDNYIFKGLLLGKDPYYMTHLLINENKSKRIYQYAEWYKIPLNTYDAMFGLGFTGLKENEAYLGIDIHECPVPFDIDRKLTEDEWELVFRYCEADVDATELVFHKTVGTFEQKLILINMFDLGREFLNKSDQKMMAELLGANYPVKADDHWDPFDYSQLDHRLNKYSEIVEHYGNENWSGLNIEIAGVPHTLGIGGLHGCRDNYSYDGEIWLADVEAYYPSLMVAYDFFARSIPDSYKKRFADIKRRRAEVKHTDKPLSNALKLVLNTTYGCFKYKYTNLFDERMANNICIAGQSLLVDLIEQLEPHIELIQSNTDGIIFRPIGDKDLIREILAEWEERSKMKLEVEVATRIVQKDVNNYVMRMDDGEIKAVGGYVRQYSPRGLRRNASIIDKALVEHLMNDVDIDEFINKCDDPMEFLMVTKVGRTYNEVFYENELGDRTELGKINRTFASNGLKGRIYKQKVGKNPELVASQSDRTLVWNWDVSELDISKIDKQWYIDVTKSRLKAYEGSK